VTASAAAGTGTEVAGRERALRNTAALPGRNHIFVSQDFKVIGAE
jgi:hypothetical protein